MAQALTMHCIDFRDWILKLLISPGKFAIHADEKLKLNGTTSAIHFETMELTPLFHRGAISDFMKYVRGVKN